MINLNARGPQTIKVLGKIGEENLPSFAKGEFERNGIACAPPCAMLQVLPGDGAYFSSR